MYGFDDPFDVDAFSRRFTRTPDDAIAGDQRTDRATDVAAVNLAIGGFYVGMHAKAADDDTFSGLAEQVVIEVCLLRGRF